MNGKMLLALAMALSIFLAQAQQPKPKATVHIYRYRLSTGTGTHPTVACDAFPVAKIQNGRVYTLSVSVGRHLVTIGDKPTGLTVDIEPGKEYFVRLDYPPNARYLGDPNPVLVAPEQGSQEVRQLRPLDKWFIENATCGQP